MRRRLTPELGARLSALLPTRYERLGSVLVLRLPPPLRAYAAAIGASYREELGVAAVLVRSGPVAGEERHPQLQLVSGTATETEVREHGVRYRFDARHIMFSRGNKSERARMGRVVGPGEVVADLFAGIGYFALPAAAIGRAARVDACEKNPEALRYLQQNAVANRVVDRIRIFPGDNRAAPLENGGYDRIFLGLLPSSVPFIERALPLLRPSGGWMHVHVAAPAHGDAAIARTEAADAVGRVGGTVLEIACRRVKHYGPGRTHLVVDVRARGAVA
ncbi:MAG TPA: class I SAM-dependent methyltransferase family protein [Thermoplasmata archaeon]|nr:class I SAM-dependent methyltransferase family protein [Thermoplasmata archaeon]